MIKCKCGTGYTVGKPPAVLAGKRSMGEINAEIAALESRLAALRAEEPSTFGCLQCGAEINCVAEVEAWSAEQLRNQEAAAAAADKANARAEAERGAGNEG